MQISPQALNWLGARELLAMWQPDTEAGAAAARRWPQATGEAWVWERRCCLLLDEALREGRLEDATARELLRGLPSLDEVVGLLDSGSLVEVAQLFRAKQVIYATVRLRALVVAVEGYPVPDSAELEAIYNLLHAPGDPVARFVLSSSRSATLAAARAAETEAHRALLAQRAEGGVSAAEEAHAEAHARLLSEEALELQAIAAALRPFAEGLRHAAEWTTSLDLRLAKCRLRAGWQGCWPEQGDELSVEDATHPVVSARVASRGGAFVRQSFALPRGISMLTGANMGGKTVALQLAGLVLLCGAAGLPAPAVRATFPVVEFVEVLAGAEAGSRHGLSSFGSEVVAWRSLLAREGKGFVLADEPARTTSPAEGAALVAGLCGALAARGWQGWIATHFGEVDGGVAASHWAVGGLGEIAASEGAGGEGSLAALESRMDYRLVPAEGAAGSDALRVAALLGLGDEVLRTARSLLASEERGRNRSS